MTIRSKMFAITILIVPIIAIVSNIIFSEIYEDYIILRNVQASRLEVTDPIVQKLEAATEGSFGSKEKYEVLNILMDNNKFTEVDGILNSLVSNEFSDHLESGQLLLMLCRNSFKAGWYDKSINYYRQYLEEYPEGHNIRNEFAGVLLESGQKDLSIAQYQKLIDLNPEYPEMYDLLADAASTEEETDKPQEYYFHIAEQAIKKSLELKPDREKWKKLVVLLSWQNKHQEVLDVITNCTPIEIREKDLCVSLALAVTEVSPLRQEETQLTFGIAQQALASDNIDTEILGPLARSARKLKYNELAKGLFEKLIKREPNNRALRYEVANFLHDIDMYQEAEYYYTELVKEKQNNTSIQPER